MGVAGTSNDADLDAVAVPETSRAKLGRLTEMGRDGEKGTLDEGGDRTARKIIRQPDSYARMSATNGRWVALSTRIRTRRMVSVGKTSRNGRSNTRGIRFCRQRLAVPEETRQQLGRYVLFDLNLPGVGESKSGAEMYYFRGHRPNTCNPPISNSDCRKRRWCVLTGTDILLEHVPSPIQNR